MCQNVTEFHDKLGSKKELHELRECVKTWQSSTTSWEVRKSYMTLGKAKIKVNNKECGSWAPASATSPLSQHWCNFVPTMIGIILRQALDIWETVRCRIVRAKETKNIFGQSQSSRIVWSPLRYVLLSNFECKNSATLLWVMKIHWSFLLLVSIR